MPKKGHAQRLKQRLAEIRGLVHAAVEAHPPDNAGRVLVNLETLDQINRIAGGPGIDKGEMD